MRRCNKVEKSKLFKGTLRTYTKSVYKITASYSSIWRKVMRGTNLKNEKNLQKITIFGTVSVRSCNQVENSRSKKTHLRPKLNVRNKFPLPSSI